MMDSTWARGSFCGPSLHELTLPGLRLALGRFLVVASFFWPFFNFDLIAPGSTLEINFLPVFAAVLILPELFFLDIPALLLTIPAYLAAFFLATPSAAARLVIAMVPMHFILNLVRRLRERGGDLVPATWAFRGLKLFVLFSVAQTINLHFLHILPAPLQDTLLAIIPRYQIEPYDMLGIHGVQGWASEPSSAGLLTCAFALVAIQQRPEWKWRVMAWFAALVVLNKSIYAITLGILLLAACMASMRRKWIALVGMVPASALVGLYIASSNRVATLRETISIDGLNSESNHELARFVQIFAPYGQLPHIYNPVILFDNWVMEPMGLLSLCVGYGSIFGLLWLLYILHKNFPISQVQERGFWLVALIGLLIMASPDLVCSIVALAVFLVTRSTGLADTEFVAEPINA